MARRESPNGGVRTCGYSCAGPKDEVITVANTYYATVRAVYKAGATPVFVDIDAKNARIDPAAVAAAVTPRTAATLAVHLYGWPAPGEALRSLAGRRGILLFEEVMAVRQDRARRYGDRLSGIPGVVLHEDASRAHPYPFPVFAREREALIAEMKSVGVQLGIHYSTNLHCLEEFGGAPAGTLPATEKHNASVVSLPACPQVTPEQIDFICEELRTRTAYPGR